MTSVLDMDQLQDSVAPGPAADRVQRAKAARFYLGLVSLMIVVVFGSLTVMAVVPYLIPDYTSASIISGSMQPNLRPGDIVIAERTGGSEVDTGTVIVFEDPRRGDLVTHRIVERLDDQTYRTQGDANRVIDPHPVPLGNIRGEGRWVVPLVGKPRVWIANGNWAAVVTTMVLAVAMTWMARWAVDDQFDPWPPQADSDLAIGSNPVKVPA